MALISELYLCKNTKLFPGSEDSYYFATETARKNFFVSKSSNALHFTALSYVRETRAVRIPVNIETAEECDYMIFCNADYGNKWYYCFIDECRYINDATTEVSFIIDPVQTWLPSCTLSSCMINRRTLNSDTKWSNILNKEDFVTGSLYPTAQGNLMSAVSPDTSYANEYVCIVSNAVICPSGSSSGGHYTFYARFNDYYAQNCGRGDNLIYYIFNKSLLGTNSALSQAIADLIAETVSGTLFNDNYRVYSVMMIPELCIPAGAITALKASAYALAAVCPNTSAFDYLDTHVGDTFTYKSKWESFFTTAGVGSFTVASYSSTPKDMTLAISWDTAKVGIFENYSPKNNKLYNSPYTKLRILNNMGEAMDLSPEYFGGFTRQPQDLTFYFKVYGFLSISPDLVLYPMDYLGSGSATINPNYRMSIAPYPQLPHNENSFAEWLQQNNVANAIKGAQGLLQVGFGAAGAIASGGALAAPSVGMAISGATQLAGLTSSFSQAKANGISTNIPNNVGAVASGLNLHKFSWQLLSLRYYDANSCDDFMSKNGYAFNGFGIPSFTYRSKWDYVKAEGASFSNAPVPAQAQREIINRLNSGLRMWHGDYLGDYSQNNAIA